MAPKLCDSSIAELTRHASGNHSRPRPHRTVRGFNAPRVYRPNCSFRGQECAFAEIVPSIGCGLGEALLSLRRIQLAARSPA
jgi:hypothetical protein